jgi:uncharacterized membrane protein
MLFPIIIGIILYFLINSQNSRISKLEESIKNLSNLNKKDSSIVDISPEASFVNLADLNTEVPKPVQEEEAPSVDQNIKTSPRTEEESYGLFLGKIGIGAVFLGIAFFIKYAFDNNWVSDAGRILVGLIVGISLFSLGQYLKKKYVNFSEILCGGGIAILYFSVFAAHSYYGLIDSFVASILLFIVTLFTFVFGILTKNVILSVIATIGGFVTPFLVATGNNNMLEIFSYLSLLNLGVLSISIYKKWPELVIVALFGTSINFGAWYNNFYSNEFLVPVLFFVAVSFLIFVFSIIYKIISSQEESNFTDYFVLIVSSVFFFFVNYITLMDNFKNPLMLFVILALAGLFYLILALVAHNQNKSDEDLNILLPFLAIVFIGVSIPIYYSGLTISVIWFIFSSLVYILSSYISSRGFQIMGVFVYISGLINFFVFNVNLNLKIENFTAFFNNQFMTLLVGILSAYIIVWLYYRFGSLNMEIQKRGVGAFIIIANVLTIVAFSLQIWYSHPLNSNMANTYISIFWALYAALITGIGFVNRIYLLRIMGLVFFVITALKVIIDVWSLGQIYRIVSFVVFGAITLVVSFVYSKYKDRLETNI